MKITVTYQTKIYLLISIISAALLIYIAVKANLASFTHDESYTYLHYVHEPFMDIISYKRAYTNNHILNTVLIKYSEHFFGSCEFALRLPNVLAFILYVIYTVKLLKKVALALILTGFICMVFNTHLLDFFGLARGYGLSFAFMMMSVYHLIRSFSSSSNKHSVLFNVGAFFAVLSNFTLLNYYVSALIIYNFLKFLDSKPGSNSGNNTYNFFHLNRIHFVALLIFTAVLYEPIRRITKQGMLDFGGKTGFVEDTLGALIRGVFYETPIVPIVYNVIQALLITLLTFIGIVIAKRMYIKDHVFFLKNRPLVVVYFIFICIIALSYAQHLVINNDFYTGRFGLFLYPLLMLNVVFCINYLYETNYRLLAILLSSSVSILLVINFCININLRFYQDWKYDSETKAVIDCMRKEHAGSTKPIKLGVNWLFEPTTNFYRYTYNLTWLIKTDRKGIQPGDDYYYIFSSDTTAYLTVGKRVLFLPEGLNTLLVKNNK